MKKLLIIVAGLLLMSTTATFAQNAKGTTKTTETKQSNISKTKKDGTPDMRYKENKKDETPVVKKKKDGTPDMRYKENKSKANK